eukprot:2772867-Rhodomonas_salina.1
MEKYLTKDSIVLTRATPFTGKRKASKQAIKHEEQKREYHQPLHGPVIAKGTIMWRHDDGSLGPMGVYCDKRCNIQSCCVNLSMGYVFEMNALLSQWLSVPVSSRRFRKVHALMLQLNTIGTEQDTQELFILCANTTTQLLIAADAASQSEREEQRMLIANSCCILDTVMNMLPPKTVHHAECSFLVHTFGVPIAEDICHRCQTADLAEAVQNVQADNKYNLLHLYWNSTSSAYGRQPTLCLLKTSILQDVMPLRVFEAEYAPCLRLFSECTQQHVNLDEAQEKCNNLETDINCLHTQYDLRVMHAITLYASVESLDFVLPRTVDFCEKRKQLFFLHLAQYALLAKIGHLHDAVDLATQMEGQKFLQRKSDDMTEDFLFCLPLACHWPYRADEHALFDAGTQVHTQNISFQNWKAEHSWVMDTSVDSAVSSIEGSAYSLERNTFIIASNEFGETELEIPVNVDTIFILDITAPSQCKISSSSHSPSLLSGNISVYVIVWTTVLGEDLQFYAENYDYYANANINLDTTWTSSTSLDTSYSFFWPGNYTLSVYPYSEQSDTLLAIYDTRIVCYRFDSQCDEGPNMFCTGSGGACQCDSGYMPGVLQKDGCSNIDECELGTHSCLLGEKCIDTNGSFACVSLCYWPYKYEGRSFFDGGKQIHTTNTTNVNFAAEHSWVMDTPVDSVVSFIGGNMFSNDTNTNLNVTTQNEFGEAELIIPVPVKVFVWEASLGEDVAYYSENPYFYVNSQPVSADMWHSSTSPTSSTSSSFERDLGILAAEGYTLAVSPFIHPSMLRLDGLEGFPIYDTKIVCHPLDSPCDGHCVSCSALGEACTCETGYISGVMETDGYVNIDECLQPENCILRTQSVCANTEGSFLCYSIPLGSLETGCAWIGGGAFFDLSSISASSGVISYSSNTVDGTSVVPTTHSSLGRIEGNFSWGDCVFYTHVSGVQILHSGVSWYGLGSQYPSKMKMKPAPHGLVWEIRVPANPASAIEFRIPYRMYQSQASNSPITHHARAEVTHVDTQSVVYDGVVLLQDPLLTVVCHVISTDGKVSVNVAYASGLLRVTLRAADQSSHNATMDEHVLKIVVDPESLEHNVDSGVSNGEDGCVNVNECELGTHSCAVDTECVDTDGSFVCEDIMCSWLEWTEGGNRSETNSSIQTHCDQPTMSCNYIDSRPVCTCSEGFNATYGPQQVWCDDIDECEQPEKCLHSTQSVCANTEGSFLCNSIPLGSPGTGCAWGGGSANFDLESISELWNVYQDIWRPFIYYWSSAPDGTTVTSKTNSSIPKTNSSIQGIEGDFAWGDCVFHTHVSGVHLLDSEWYKPAIEWDGIGYTYPNELLMQPAPNGLVLEIQVPANPASAMEFRVPYRLDKQDGPDSPIKLQVRAEVTHVDTQSVVYDGAVLLVDPQLTVPRTVTSEDGMHSVNVTYGLLRVTLRAADQSSNNATMDERRAERETSALQDFNRYQWTG